MTRPVRPKAPWILGVTQPEVDAVPVKVREAIAREALRVFNARLRVWIEYKRQQVKLAHSTTKLDEVLRSFGDVLLCEVKRTADEFMVEDSRARTARRKRATYERKKKLGQVGKARARNER